MTIPEKAMRDRIIPGKAENKLREYDGVDGGAKCVEALVEAVEAHKRLKCVCHLIDQTRHKTV